MRVNAASVISTSKSIARAIYHKIRLSLISDPEARKVVAARKKACDECVFNSTQNFTPSIRPDDHCTLCGCNIALKVFDLEGACTIKKLNESVNHKMRVRWDVYKPNPDGKR